jgi:hypothetical protein
MSQPAKPAAPTDAAAAAAASSMQQPRKGNSKRPIAAEAAGASNEDRPAKAAKPHAAASVGSDEFSQLTVTVLKGRCQQLGLPVTGNKATLIARLKEEDREFEETAEEVEELPQNSFGDTEEDIWEYKFDPKVRRFGHLPQFASRCIRSRSRSFMLASLFLLRVVCFRTC